MHRATSSASSSTSASTHRSRRHDAINRKQLLTSFKSFGRRGPTSPLHPGLPSPPDSRSNSPVPGSKRKSESDVEQGHSKKPRTSRPPETARQPPPTPAYPIAGPSTSHIRSDPSEDGELREDPPAFRSAGPSYVPVRRPRRGNRVPESHFNAIHDKYMVLGRTFKFSGDVRLRSTYPQRASEYTALRNPPHSSSPYHKFGNLIARLELLDGLISFFYAFWSRDFVHRTCHKQWGTMKQYITYCKTKWQMEDAADEREKAFLGLIWMLEGFMEGRQYAYVAKAYHTEHERMSVRLKNMWQAEQEEAAKKSRPTDSIATPPMLPSPASIATTSSANSTPTNHSTGAPAATKTQNESKTSRPGEDEKEKLPPPHLTVPVNANFVYNRQSQSAAIVNASRCMGYSQRTLTLPILAKHFPRTFARMIYTTYSITDEHEADIEDEEGELFWPGQLATGEGIGWVCLMGKAMIKEFGKDLGYRGYEGVIPKDEAAPAQEDVADPSSGPSSSTPVPFS